MVIGSYGTSSARPRILGGRMTVITGSGGTPDFIDHLAITDLDFDGTGTGDNSAIFWLGGGRDILIENCYAANFRSGNLR